MLAAVEIDAEGGASHLLEGFRVDLTVQAASRPMRVKVLHQRLRLLALLQSPYGVVHRIPEDHRIGIQGDKPPARMSCRGGGNDKKEQSPESPHLTTSPALDALQ